MRSFYATSDLVRSRLRLSAFCLSVNTGYTLRVGFSKGSILLPLFIFPVKIFLALKNQSKFGDDTALRSSNERSINTSQSIVIMPPILSRLQPLRLLNKLDESHSTRAKNALGK